MVEASRSWQRSRPAAGVKIQPTRPMSASDIHFEAMHSDFGMLGLPPSHWKGSVSSMSREEIDAKLERTEARVNATLAEVRSDFATARADMATFREEVSSKLSHIPSKSFLVGTSVGIVAVLLAAIGIGAAMFGNGIMVATSSVDRANQALTVSEQNQSQIQTLSQDIGAVLEEVRALRQQAVQPEE